MKWRQIVIPCYQFGSGKVQANGFDQQQKGVL